MSDTLKILDIDFAFIPADKGLNYIICKEFKEVFFDIFEINCGGNKIIAEKVDSLNGDPVLKIATEYDGKLYNSLYVLKEGDDNVILNIKSLDGGKKVFAKEKEILESVAEEESLPDPEPIIEETYIVTENAAVDIEKYKADAIRVINENFSNKKQKIEQLSESLTNLIDKRLSELKSSSVTDIDSLKSDILTKFDEKVNQVEIISDRAVAEANSIRESIEATAELYTNIVTTNVDEKTKQLQDLKESVVYDINTKIAELQAELVNQETQVNSAFQSIQTFIDESKKQLLEQKTTNVADVENICNESKQVVTENLKRAETLVAKKINSLQSAADKKINDITTLVENRISIFDNRINDINGAIERAETSLQEQINQGLNSILTEARSHSAILDDKKNEIEKIISNTANELSELGGNIVESVEKKIKDFNLVAIKKEDLNSLKKQLETRIENESANLKKYVAGYGGGGSVAQQFAAGGTMNGTLNVATGQILSAGIDLFDIFAGGSGPSGEPLFTSWAQTYSANYQSTYSTVFANSASWGAGGAAQTLSFNESTAQLTISDGNTISLSALSGGTAGVSYLSALNDVSIPAPVNGQVLTYNSITKKWNAGTPLSASGATGYYGSFYDTTEQTLTSTTQAKRIDIAQTYEHNGVSIDNNRIVFNYSGVYELIYSIQYKNTDTSQQDIYIWFKQNGADIPNSSSIFTIPARKNDNIPAQLIAVTPFMLTLTAGDFIELYWHCSNTAVSIETFTTHSNPTIPDTPGVIVTVKQVTNVQIVPTVGAYLPLSGGTLTGAVSTNQDIEITDSTKGIILKSSGGFKYRVTVTDAGELITTSV